MLIIGTFQYSLELEESLAEIENNGISRNKILVVPVNPNSGGTYISNIKAQDFYSRGIEVGISSATACSVIGTCLGFKFKWGPIIWGLVFGGIGFVIGFGIWYLFNMKSRSNSKKRLPEIVVIVECIEKDSKEIIENMWTYGAITIGKTQNLKTESI